MPTLSEIHTLVFGNPELRQRFLAARLKTAWDILNESEATNGHAQRLVWANEVINTYIGNADSEYRRFLSNPTIQASGSAATESDILFVVSSFVNTWAGVP